MKDSYKTKARLVEELEALRRKVANLEGAATRNKEKEFPDESLIFPEENPNPVLQIDSDAVILYANPPAKTLLNSLHIKIGQTVPDDWKESIVRALKSGINREVETSCEGKIFSCFFVPAVHSRKVNVYGYDVTEKKRMEKELKGYYEKLEDRVREQTSELQKTVEHLEQEISRRKRVESVLREEDKYIKIALRAAKMGTWKWNLQSNKVFWSDNTEMLFGLEPGTFSGSHEAFLHFIHPEDRERIQKEIFEYMNDPSETKENKLGYRMVNSSEEIRYMESYAEMLRDEAGHKLSLVGVVVNITERVKIMEELIKSKVKAEAGNRAKSIFLANMSHELRTPLNSIIGFSKVLRKQFYGQLNEQQLDYVNDILDSGQHLLSLINDILDISKVEAEKIVFEPVDMSIKELVARSQLMVKETAQKHGVHIDLKISEELDNLLIKADERLLKQVMFNLLSNAVKFTPAGGIITVAAERIDDNIVVSITDTGVGIAPEEQDNIFEAFYQVKEDIKMNPSGTGLGLPLSKRLIELHSGSLWIESEGRGKGSRFTFKIPIKQ